MNGDGPERSLVRRLGWFVLLWALGVFTVGVVALAIRAVLFA